MDTDFDVKIVTPGDPALLGRIADGVFDHAIAPALLAAYLQEPGHRMLVAVQERTVVGQCRAMLHRHPDRPPELYIDNLGVAPALRRNGIGRALVSAMLDWGRAEGCTEAWVGTEPDNIPARTLYRRAGGAEETVAMVVLRLSATVRAG